MTTTSKPTVWMIKGERVWGYISDLHGEYVGTVSIGPRNLDHCRIELPEEFMKVRYGTFEAAENGVRAMVDRLDVLAAQAAGISSGVAASLRQWLASTDLRGDK